jgi:hypothetical protein
MTKTEAIRDFLLNRAAALGNVNEVYARRYTNEHEVQVNVIKSGEVVHGVTTVGKTWTGYRDPVSGQTYKHFRIPWGANSDPKYTDGNLNFSLDQFAEAIGCTGWNWVNRSSDWFGFDFDSIVGHKAGLSDDDLKLAYEAIRSLKYVSVFTSSSGRGYHFYIDIINSPVVDTHTTHSAIARALLSKISSLCGFPLVEKADVCGGNIWLWRRGAKGYKLLKEAEEPLDLNTIRDWKEHLEVVSRKGKRTTILKDDESWKTINSSLRRIELDEEHRKLLQWLTDHKKLWWWDADHWMLVTHTSSLKQAHTELQLTGIFETISEGKEEGDQNCFAFPLSNGAWIIRRHTKGCNEHGTWRTDKSGWTYAFFNRIPSIDVACSLHGVEGDKNIYYYKTLSSCISDLQVLGIQCDLPGHLAARQADVKDLGSGKILVTFERYDGDTDLEGWYVSKNRKCWKRVFTVTQNTTESYNVDYFVRHLVAQGKEAGWYINSQGRWIEQPKSNVVDVLAATGIPRTAITGLLGESVLQHWTLVNLPFKEEYPGNRQWNKYAAQLAFQPHAGDYVHWRLILEHIGKNLDTTTNEWCRNNGVFSGADYLFCWIASLITVPLEPLPYLFLYGPQGCGKSILHESLKLLFTSGVSRADVALVNSGYFNGEIEGAVLCVVEETNLRKTPTAYEKIKDWVTSPIITIHKKGKMPYDTVNSTHWIQCSNDPSYCPIFPGDTRITVIHVPPLTKEIPKLTLLSRLKDEAPAFLQALMEFELPEPIDRLRIPVLQTPEKELQEELNENDLITFIKNYLKPCDGNMIKLNDFIDKFMTILPQTEHRYWTSRKIAANLPEDIVRGKYGQYNETHLANVCWNYETIEPTRKLQRVNGRLV